MTVTGNCNWGSNSSGVISPSRLAGFIKPPPVAYSTITEPAASGLLDELRELSWFSAAACPTPLPSAAKMPGAEGARLIVIGGDRCCPSLTCTTALLPDADQGTKVPA